MLGAIKGDTEANVSLFRRLSRHWRPLARVKRERLPLTSALGAEEETKHAPVWIGVRRPPHVPPATLKNAKRSSATTWNPWLWTK